MNSQRVQKKLPELSSAIIFLIISILCLGVFDFFAITSTSPTAVLEILFFLVSISIVIKTPKISKTAAFFFISSSGYLVYGYLLAVLFGDTDALDFMQAYKAFYYIPLLSLILYKPIFRKTQINLLLQAMATTFLIRYGLEKFVLGQDRPTLLTENNFELILLALVFAARNIAYKEINWPITIAILFIFLLSGSRSSIIAMVFALLATPGALSFSLSRLKKSAFAVYAFGTASGILAIIIFLSRMTEKGVTGIDRVRFLYVFLEETKDWGILQYLKGTPPLTPLSDTACSTLSFYEKLFSYSGDGSCYSVILHSYVLRSIFDHGLLGLFFVFFFIFKLPSKQLSSAVLPKISVVLIIFATALSVSAINNVYVVLGLVFLTCFNPESSASSNRAIDQGRVAA